MLAHSNRTFILFALFSLLLLHLTATGEKNISVINTSELPCIEKFNQKDEMYKQYSSDVEKESIKAANKKISSGIFYTYHANEGDTLLTIAASCCLPYDTIATANGFSGIDEVLQGRTVVLPAAAGIFVSESPSSPIETLMHEKYIDTLEKPENMCYNIDGRIYVFLENKRFSPTERAFFLDASMKLPLEQYWLSSAYGMRRSPITGKWKFHEGIDMAAPTGTSVYACKSGRAELCKTGDPVYGDYIILSHGSKMTSLYAHLSKILVHQGESVQSGNEIGKVGMTGAATGAHLHFEIRFGGISDNPQRYIKK